MKMEFLCENHFSHALAYVLSNGWSRSREFDFKRRTQDISLSRCHVASWVEWWLSNIYNMQSNEEFSIYHDRAWGDTRFTKTKSEDRIQVGQHMKHKECITWDHVILWYGKPCQLYLMNLPIIYVSLCYLCRLVIFPGACISKVRYHIAHERMTSSGGLHQGWERESSRWESREDHMLEAFCQFGDNGHMKMCLNEAIPCGVWGANCESSQSNNDKVKHSLFN
jgi:hypothetical protein